MESTGQKTTRSLHRSMRETPDGEPLVGPTARTLGSRPDIDIPVEASGQVRPGTGGMSVAPDSPNNLPPHRRPPAHGGTGKDPVWRINQGDLGPDLKYVPDEVPHPTHGVIEPSGVMPLEQYQQALEQTAS